MRKDIVIHWIESQIKYTCPKDISGLQSTCLRWKSGEKDYEKTIFWSCSKGIECRPSHLLVSPSGNKLDMSGELEFRVVSAVEPFKVVDVVCLEAKLHLEQNSDELLRQHTVKLKITPNASIASRVNLTVHTSNSQGEMSEVDLPVIFAP